MTGIAGIALASVLDAASWSSCGGALAQAASNAGARLEATHAPRTIAAADETWFRSDTPISPESSRLRPNDGSWILPSAPPTSPASESPPAPVSAPVRPRVIPISPPTVAAKPIPSAGEDVTASAGESLEEGESAPPASAEVEREPAPPTPKSRSAGKPATSAEGRGNPAARVPDPPATGAVPRAPGEAQARRPPRASTLAPAFGITGFGYFDERPPARKPDEHGF